MSSKQRMKALGAACDAGKKEAKALRKGSVFNGAVAMCKANHPEYSSGEQTMYVTGVLEVLNGVQVVTDAHGTIQEMRKKAYKGNDPAHLQQRATTALQNLRGK